MSIKEERRKLAEWTARFRAQFAPISRSWAALKPKRRLNTDGTPRQAVERHFAHEPINVEALKAAKQKALHARARMAKQPKKGGV